MQILNNHVNIISIHALHEESDYDGGGVTLWYCKISIHALHEESDLSLTSYTPSPTIFQSTLSMRRATSKSRKYTQTTTSNFNPRSP